MKKVLIFSFIILISGYITSQETKQGSKLPSVNLKTLEGQTFNTKDINNNGKPILISFWALWCTPCKKELDAYNDNYEDWKEETGVKIIAVSIDDARSSAKVLPFVMGKDWDFDVLLDPNGDFKRAMSVNIIPHIFILDGQGNIVYQHTSHYEGLEDEVFDVIKKVAAGEYVSNKK